MLKTLARHFRAYEVVRTNNRGQPLKGEHMLIRFVPHQRVKKALVTVSGKTEKLAVRRNRLRRQVYAALGELWENLPSGFFSVIVRPRKEIEYQDILSDLKQIFIHGFINKN